MEGGSSSEPIRPVPLTQSTRSTESPSLHTYACLVGNGLAIAYEPQLAIPELTRSITRAFQERAQLPDATPAAQVLGEFATSVRGDAAEGFERLLGPLDSVARAIPALSGLAPVVRAQQTGREDLERLQALLIGLHRFGVGEVLNLIAGLAEATHETRFSVTVQSFVEALLGLIRPNYGRLTIATLNYDGLLHAALLEHVQRDDGWEVGPSRIASDLADGRSSAKGSHQLLTGSQPCEGQALRSIDDLLIERTALLQLHGSLAWLRDPVGGAVWKFRLDDLRRLDYWIRWRDGETDWEPVVVLTDQKTKAVTLEPFNLAYRAFETRLVAADRWMIAGYGFGDEPVQMVLRSALHRRRTERLGEPRLLILDVGEPADEPDRIEELADLFRLDKTNVFVDLAGLPRSIDGEAWRAWNA